jgi:hypothetical protein
VAPLIQGAPKKTGSMGAPIQKAPRPCVGSVKLACRHLIFTAKFLPAIAEVREAIKEQAKRLSYVEYDAAIRLPRHLGYLKSPREYERRLVECFYRLERLQTNGDIDEPERAKRRAKIAADYDPDIVADAQARVDAGCWLSAPNGIWYANGKPWVDPRGLIDGGNA